MRCDVLGVAVDNLTLSEAVGQARTFLAGDRTCTVVTPNAEIVYLAHRDPAVREALNAADLILPDGIGVLKAARMLGCPIYERVAGIDFAQALLPWLAQDGIPVFFFGGGPGVAEEAARRMTAIHPGLTVRGIQDGYFPAGAEGGIAADIRAAGARVVFICLGAPKQELFMQAYGARTGARLLIGLGGSFDVWAGRVKRAPRTFIKFGLEWLYRILRQPKRILRAVRLPAFLWAVRRAASSRK